MSQYEAALVHTECLLLFPLSGDTTCAYLNHPGASTFISQSCTNKPGQLVRWQVLAREHCSAVRLCNVAPEVKRKCTTGYKRGEGTFRGAYWSRINLVYI